MSVLPCGALTSGAVGTEKKFVVYIENPDTIRTSAR
jgi:hypothetical protein